jgi:hypothetical protein
MMGPPLLNKLQTLSTLAPSTVVAIAVESICKKISNIFDVIVGVN